MEDDLDLRESPRRFDRGVSESFGIDDRRFLTMSPRIIVIDNVPYNELQTLTIPLLVRLRARAGSGIPNYPQIIAPRSSSNGRFFPLTSGDGHNAEPGFVDIASPGKGKF